MEAGIKGMGHLTAGVENSAKAMGSGDLDVLATPALVALIEETAWRSIASELSEGESTVGIFIELSHLAATPLGMQVSCETELVEVNGRKLVFDCIARDAVDIIAKARHERFIVQGAAFEGKAAEKGQV